MILVTGCAGFIGFHLCARLLRDDEQVIGIDNLNGYYDVNLKQSRLRELRRFTNFQFIQMDLANSAFVKDLFAKHKIARVVNLAAQPGVRYSLTNPAAYIESNVVGFANLLEMCRQSYVEHLVFASSSSVYGANTKMPYSVHDNVDHPISLYAATKKSNELMAHTYSHLFNLPCTGLRFFTVYGPWGRPDMAIFKFTKALFADEAIEIYNYGDMRRDFTYVEDIVEGILRVIKTIPVANPEWNGDLPDPGSSKAPYRIYNIGNNNPVELMKLVQILEKETGRKARLNLLPLQPGDVLSTFADVSDLERSTGFRPTTSIEVGVEKFVQWYVQYYGTPKTTAMSAT